MDEGHERQIALGLHEGNVAAWNALYEEHASRMWQSVARWMGPDSADVADVVQETFLAAARSARGYDSNRGSLWHWLTGIARKQVALHYRKQHRQNRVREAAAWLAGNEPVLRWLDNCELGPPEAASAAEMATLIRVALSELSPEYEAVLTARYLDETSVDAMAAANRSTPIAVRSKLARARRALRELLLRKGRVGEGCGARKDE